MRIDRFLLYALIFTMPFSIRLVGGIFGNFHVTTDELIMSILILIILIRSSMVRAKVKFAKFDYILLCFTGLCYISILLNETSLPPILRFTKVWTEYIALYFIIKFFAAGDYKLNRNFIYLIMATGFILAFNPTGQITTSERAQSTFTNPNTFGAYIVIISCLFLSFALNKRKYRGLFWIAIPLLGWALLTSYSRTAMVAYIFAFFIILFFKTKKFLFLAFCLIPVVFFVLPIEYSSRIESIFNVVDSDAKTPKSMVDRYSGWKSAMTRHGFDKGFMLGIGSDRTIIDNQYISILVYYGLIAFVLFLYILYRIMRIIWDGFNLCTLPYTRDLSLAYFGILSMMMVQSMTARTFFSPRLGGVFWGLFAVLVNLINIDIRRQVQEEKEEEERNAEAENEDGSLSEMHLSELHGE